MEMLFIILVVVILSLLVSVYTGYMEEQNCIKEEVENDYNDIIRHSKLVPKVLQWVSTLNDRFEAFVNSKEYQTIKPYDKFALKPPTRYLFSAFIVVDKNKNLKLTVNFEPSVHDGGRTDKYLKYCVGYNHGLKEFIKDCEKKVMADKLEKERIKNVENVINK